MSAEAIKSDSDQPETFKVPTLIGESMELVEHELDAAPAVLGRAFILGVEAQQAGDEVQALRAAYMTIVAAGIMRANPDRFGDVTPEDILDDFQAAYADTLPNVDQYPVHESAA